MRALLTGITGMDGALLAKFLLEKDYKVFGTYRRLSTPNFWRLQHLKILDKVKLLPADLLDESSIIEAVRTSQPDEIYNLAAMSFVGASFEQPIASAEITGLGALRVLEAIRQTYPRIRYYQSSTSEMFGVNGKEGTKQSELTPFMPSSPYAAAKLFAYHTTKIYREGYDIFAVNGILFNHEGSLRGLEFVTRKVTNAVARIKLGLQKTLELGNLDAKRDWGYASEYCIDLDVPILTPCGWRYHNEIHDGDEIINFDPITNHLTRDRVNKLIRLPSNGDRVHIYGRSFDLTCTHQHRIYFQQKSKNSKGGWSDWKIITALDLYNRLADKALRTKYDYRLPHFQDYDGKEDERWSDKDIYLLGALLAEGNIRDSRDSRTVLVSLSQSGVKNKATYDKIISCLDSLELTYTTRLMNCGTTEWILDTVSSHKILSMFDSNDIHMTPQWAFNLSARQANILFNALMDCDGHWGSLTYVSKRSRLAADFQTIASLAGYACTQMVSRRTGDCFTVTAISKRRKYQYFNEVELQSTNQHTVWCVNTPHGTIITRNNNKISISGNCESMWLMMQQRQPDDYVIATGETHSVQELVELAFSCVGLNWQDFVRVDKQLLRPVDVKCLCGDNSKAKRVLGWEPKVKFKELIELMVQADLSRWERWQKGEHFPWDAPNYTDDANIVSAMRNRGG